MPDPQLRIATRLLSGTLYQTQERSPEERSEAIELALEVAAELLSKRGRGLPKLENTPPASESAKALTTKERVIEREPLAPLNTLLTNRRGRSVEAADKPGRKGPTVH